MESFCLRGQPLKFEVLAVLFRFRAEFTERSKLRAGGGLRYGKFAGRKGEQMKLEMFAIP